MRTYTIKDAVDCGEWKHYTDAKTGNIVYERTAKTWTGRARRIWHFITFWMK